MAKRSDPGVIPAALESLLPHDRVRRLARETGLVTRERKIDPVAMLWTLVLGFGVSLQRTLADLKRAYEKKTGKKLSDGSWHPRFSPELVEFMRSCVGLAIEGLSAEVSGKPAEPLRRFKDILVQDSSVVRLNEKLAKKFPATRSRKVAAGVKVSLLVSAVANGPKHVAIRGERVSETKTLRIGKWVRDRILLIDLGFYKHRMFARIAENGGYFVSRLKESADPLIVASHRVHRGRAVDIVGKRWSEVEPLLQRGVLDAEVEITFSRRVYAGKGSKDTMRLRLVAVLNEETKEYHVYLTNIGTDALEAKEVADLYSVRWDVELVFKELKSRYSMDVLTSANENVVHALIWAAILTLLVSRRLYNRVRAQAPEGMKVRYTQLRWATIFAEDADDLLGDLLWYWKLATTTLERLQLRMAVYSSQAVDPHVNRERLKDGWVA